MRLNESIVMATQFLPAYFTDANRHIVRTHACLASQPSNVSESWGSRTGAINCATTAMPTIAINDSSSRMENLKKKINKIVASFTFSHTARKFIREIKILLRLNTSVGVCINCIVSYPSCSHANCSWSTVNHAAVADWITMNDVASVRDRHVKLIYDKHITELAKLWNCTHSVAKSEMNHTP